MNSTIRFGYEDEALKTWLRDDVAVIELKGCVYGTITDLAESGRLLSFFHAAEVNPEVTSLLLSASADCFSAEKFLSFFEKIKPREDGESLTAGEIEMRNQRIRYANVLNRVVTQLADFRKISVVCFRGNVVTPFFGVSLAADMRYVGPEMVFDPAHIRFGVHPGGALPFFLPLYLGYGKAAEILYNGRVMTARELLDLGLVNEMIGGEDFLESCMERLQEFSRSHNRKALLSTKMLLGDARRGLSRYLDREAALIV